MTGNRPLQGSFDVAPLAQSTKHADAITVGRGPTLPALTLSHDFQCQVNVRKGVMVGQLLADGTARKFVEVDLGGTYVGPCPPVTTTSDLMGPFTDRVVVTMKPQHDGLAFAWDDPYAANSGHAATHTVSYQGMASGGSFGPQSVATGSIGFQVGDSQTMDYTDWATENHTTGSTVCHEYYMAAAGTNPYDRNDPGSGVFPPQVDKSFQDRVENLGRELDGALHRPPALSLSNVPVVSHALWKTESLDDTVTLSISVEARFVVVVRIDGLIAQFAKAVVDQTWETYCTIPLGDIGP